MGSNSSHDALSDNSLRHTVHTHRSCVHQAAKSVPALLRVAAVTAGMVESNGSLPRGLWLTSPAGRLPRTGISSGTLCSVIEYGLPFLIVSVTVKRFQLSFSKCTGVAKSTPFSPIIPEQNTGAKWQICQHAKSPVIQPTVSLSFAVLQDWLHGLPGLFTDTSEHIRF